MLLNYLSVLELVSAARKQRTLEWNEYEVLIFITFSSKLPVKNNGKI
jgi:hypothetical protein